MPPRGGPEDTTPPVVVQTRPVRDTVNVSTGTQRLRIDFSEYVERGSLPRSLSVTPTFERRLQFDWSGRSVEIEFPEPLRDSTTYIFRMDTNLSDVHGVSLENPITIAFSTGPRINQGQIQGRVLSGLRGEPKAQVDVYAYALPPTAEGPPRPLPDEPSYRTQTGEEGTFTFGYMREQDYYLVALQDNNRNRQPDALEPFAVPPRLALRADSGAAPVPVPWLLTRTDTIAPTLQGVQSLSRQRFRVNFDEPIQLETRTASEWAPRDSVKGEKVEVQAVYADPDRASAVMVRAEPMQEARYVLPLKPGLVVDTAGRALASDTARFQAASRADTTQTRFRGFLHADLSPDSTGAHPLLDDTRPGVRFNQTPDSSVLRRGLSVRDTTGQSRAYSVSTPNGTAYHIELDTALTPGQFIDVTVSGAVFADADTTYRRRYRRVTRRALGGLAGRVVVADTTLRGLRAEKTPSVHRVPPAVTGQGEADTLTVSPLDSVTAQSHQRRLDSLYFGGPARVELMEAEASILIDPRSLTTTPGSTFTFESLPEGRFRFRAYLDRDGDGQWDGGRIQPYASAEPVAWLQEPIEVRPRWTTELPAPLRIPVLAPVPARRERPSTDTTRVEPGPNP